MALIEGTAERDALKTLADADTLSALDGNDKLFNRHDDTVLIGGSGNDQYRMYSVNGTIFEEADGGHDTIWAWDSITMPDNVEDLEFKKINGWHAIRGNDLGNRITAGAGTQALAGKGGDDILTGGADADSFHIEEGEGHDTITDFEVGLDTVMFWSAEYSEFDALLDVAQDTAAGVVFAISADQSITLEGVEIADLSARDFGLAKPEMTPASEPEVELVLTFEDLFDSAEATAGQWNSSPTNGHPVTNSVARGSRFHTYVDEEGYGYSPFEHENGILSITAERTPEALADQVDTDWISGQLDTLGTFSQIYGYYEVRAKVPEGQSFWPAFWLVRDDFTWPPEADILELLGDQTDVYQVAVHSELWGRKVTGAANWLIPDASADFHTYGMIWTPQYVTFTFDGREMFRVATPADMHEPMSLRLNLAIGGWRGDPDETTPDSGAFEVDHVRVYQIPGIETLERATDTSAYGDVENGLLNINRSRQLDLYGETVHRAEGQETADLSLGADEDAALVGDARDNSLSGNDLGTTFNGEDGDDSITALGGDDVIMGQAGNDTLDGGTGADYLVGGSGDDVYVLRRGDGSAAPAFDLILEKPGGGFDTIYFVDLLPDDIRSYIDWARWHIVVEGPAGPEYFASKVTPGVGGHDLGSYVEQVVFADGTVWDLTGGLYLSGDDRGTVSSGSVHADTILGNGGEDTLVGMDGDDILDGGAGVDDIYGWNGDDFLSDSGTEDGDRLFGEAGNDTLTGGAGIDDLHGGSGDDLITASADGDRAYGGEGNDTLVSGVGDDTLDGGEGTDTARYSGEQAEYMVTGDALSATVTGPQGTDILTGVERIEFADRVLIFGAENLAPEAGADAYTLHAGGALSVAAAAGLLANDSDAEGDAISVISVSTAEHGTLSYAADGSFDYLPEAGFLGTEVLSYTISDGGSTATGSLTLTVTNTAPVAGDDTLSVMENGSGAGDVLANDRDPDGDALTVSLVGDVQHGALVLGADGGFTYTPDADYHGTDSFTYTIGDGLGGSDSGEVRLTIEKANDAPVANGDRAETGEGTAVLIDVLANDHDPDGDPLGIFAVTQGAHGVVTIDDNGTPDDTTDDRLLYAPDADYDGTDSFTYTIRDGEESATATVSVSVTARAGEDILGTGSADTISGHAGDDTINSRGGDDTIDGGAGADRINGAGGADGIVGGAGDDTVIGANGEDVLSGDANADVLAGGRGADLIFGGSGDDKLDGGSGDDTLDGGAGFDRYEGGAGADLFLFRFDEIDRDFLRDFTAEDRIHVLVEGSADGYSAVVDGRKITLTDAATGLTAMLTADGVGADDIEFITL